MLDIIEIIKVIIIAVVEGITEFLPISSTGHMILVEEVIKLKQNKEFVKLFMVVIQLGAIISVIVYFWKDIWPFTKNKETNKKKWIMWSKVLVAVIPAAVLGLQYDDYIETNFFNSKIVAISLLVYGIVLIFIEKTTNKQWEKRILSIDNITYKTAFLVGYCQCLALVPGTSRSAATIIGGLLLGLSRSVAAEFSFFLAIPVMFGATLLKLVKGGSAITASQWIILLIGNVVAFVVALVVIKFLMAYIKKRDFKLFGYYRVVLGIIILVLIAFKIM